MRWAAPLGPRRLKGTNPRTAGTDLRTAMTSPRLQGCSPRALAGVQTAREARIASMPPGGPRDALVAHERATRRLQAAPAGVYYDSGWRRAAVRASLPCARCADTLWIETPDGVVPCVERVPQADELPP